MNTAEDVFSAARAISKAQLPDGTYVPTSQLTAEQREALRRSAFRGGRYGSGGTRRNNVKATSQGTYYTQFKNSNKGPDQVKTRDVKGVYGSHGVEEGIADAVKEKTRQSKVHPNVLFGSSVSPAMEEKIDRALKADLARSSKHPLAFHYGFINPGAYAAATGSHVTVGNTGRIIMNSHFFHPNGGGKGLTSLAVNFGEVVNHEAAHALKHNKNPRGLFDAKGKLVQTRTLGEEARADARGIHGDGLYRKGGLVATEKQIKAQEATTRFLLGDKAADEAIAGHRNYNSVHEKAQAAYGTKDNPRNEKLKAIADRWNEIYANTETEAPEAPRPSNPSTGEPLRRVRLAGVSPRRAAVGVGAAAVAGGAAYGWREYQHRRANDGKFVSKRMGEVSY